MFAYRCRRCNGRYAAWQRDAHERSCVVPATPDGFIGRIHSALFFFKSSEHIRRGNVIRLRVGKRRLVGRIHAISPLSVVFDTLRKENNER